MGSQNSWSCSFHKKVNWYSYDWCSHPFVRFDLLEKVNQRRGEERVFWWCFVYLGGVLN